MIYCYWISLGLASLHKMNKNGNDMDKPHVRIGRFKTDKEAREACMKHYNKACNMADVAGREKPSILWM